MATTLGSLVVRLGLDAAEFTTGLTRAERDAQRFVARTRETITTLANAAVIGFSGMAVAAAAAFKTIDTLAKQAGDFQDLAEMTGASAEGLASFAVAAGTAGADMSTIADASVKLSKGLTGVDDESKAAGAAIAALGLSVKEFKDLAPEAQIEEVARALAGFEDGASKTAVAVALFGKSGAQLLPFLKELAAEGGRQVILTRQQIEMADAYADAQSRLRTELNLYAQAAATQALPAVNVLIGATADLVKGMLDLDEVTGKIRDGGAIQSFAEAAAKSLGFVVDVGDSLVRILTIVAKTAIAGYEQMMALGNKDLAGLVRIGNEYKKSVQETLMRPTFGASVDSRFEALNGDRALRAQEDRGFRPPGRQLRFSGAVKAEGDKVSEAQRYLDNLQKQIDRTMELTAVEQARNEILGGLKGLTPEIERQIIALAGQIDAYKELDKWLKESAQQFDEQVKKQRELLDAQNKLTNAALDRAKTAQDNNERLRDEIAITLGGVNAQKALAKAYADSAVAEAEKDRLIRASMGASEAELEAIEATIDALREYRELLDGKDLAEKLMADVLALQDVKNMFADDFADTFTDIANGTKTVKEAFVDLGNTILQQINRIAAQNLANAIFGGSNSGGPDIFGVLMKLIGAGIGGGTPAIGNMGADFLIPGMASGGIARGGLTLVGEQGPELVNLPRGAKVSTAAQTRGMMGGQNVTLNFSVAGPVNRATEYQIAQAAQRGLARAGRR